MSDLDRIRELVTAWRNGAGTELSAARCMYEIARVLGLEPPRAVKGKCRKGKTDGESL